MSLLNSLLKIEELLKCKICDEALNKTHVVGECGHNFCYECVKEKLGKEAKCPSCHLPAVIKNLHKSLMYDSLLAHTIKLKKVLQGESAFNHDHSQNTVKITLTDTSEEVNALDHSIKNDQKQPAKKIESKNNNSNGHTKTVEPLDFNDMSNLSSLSGIGEEAIKAPKSSKSKEEMSDNKEDSNHAKKRKISTSDHQSNDNNDDYGLGLNDFSITDNKDNSNNEASKTGEWKCKWCLFKHEAYIQTCSICGKYKGSEYVPRASQKNRSSTSLSSLSNPPSQNNSQQPSTSNQKVPKKRKLEEEIEEIHIMPTGLSEKEETLMKRTLTSAAKAGMRVVIHHDMKRFDQVSHVITSIDKKGLCKRTLKYLSSIVHGKWIVDHTWFSHSVEREQWLREQPYEAKGDQVAGATHAPSIGRKNLAEKRSLFGDMQFYFSGEFPSKYNKKDLTQLCEAAGGNIVKRKPPPLDNDMSRIIIIQSNTSKDPNNWLDDFQVKDPSWIIDSVSKLSLIK